MSMRLKEHLHNIKKKITHPERTVYNICMYDRHQFAPLFSDKFYLKCLYKKHLHKKLNLRYPTSFNEKLQWLKLYDRNPLYTQMADKAEMKQYVSQIIGDEHIIKTLGVYNSVEEVPFESLPDKFVIKCTHDSGSTYICKDKDTFDFQKAKDELSIRLKKNYYWEGREWPYKNIPHRIIADELLDDGSGHELNDYKFWCFNGKPTYMYCTVNHTEY